MRFEMTARNSGWLPRIGVAPRLRSWITPAVTRIATFLIVVTLAAAPAENLVCLAWCAAAAYPHGTHAACHARATGDPVVVANDNCGIVVAGTPFLREDTRREKPAIPVAHAGPIARSAAHTYVSGRIGFSPGFNTILPPPASSAVLRI